jgi:hypothetical protein
VRTRRLGLKADVTDRAQSTISLLAQQFFSREMRGAKPVFRPFN